MIIEKISNWDLAAGIAVAIVPVTLLVGLPISTWRFFSEERRSVRGIATAVVCLFLVFMIVIGAAMARRRPRVRRSSPPTSPRLKPFLLLYVAARVSFAAAIVGRLWLDRSGWPWVLGAVSLGLLVAASVVGRRERRTQAAA